MADPKEELLWQRCSPSDALTSLFRACSKDATEVVQATLDHLLKRFMESCRSTSTDEKKLVRLQKCCCESKVWYYKILEGLLQESGQNPGVKNVSNFLEDKELQCCLVVCCLEITSYTNKLASNFCPQLLQIFDLAPYNFWKVLFLVLQTKVDLTLYVTGHLVKVEEMIVESLVWAKDSPLWEEIRANEGQMPYCQQVMLPKELDDPMRKEQSDHHSLQVDGSTLNRSQRKKCLYMFARKVYRLMHKRLTALCSCLKLQEELRLKIWTCFEYSLVHHFDTLRDRQLDWLLLCAAHDLIKDVKELPFKHIINCYRSKHMSKIEPTLRGRPEESPSDNNHGGRFPTPTSSSGCDQEDDAITWFYCQVYTPVMGHFVKKFALAPGTETPPLSPYPKPPPVSTRRCRWRPGYNVFVSPYNKESSPQPRTGIDYVVQSSPSQRLDEINTMVSSSRSQSKRNLNFNQGDDDKDEEDGPSAKMQCMSEQSSLIRRLQDVEDDRRQSRVQDKAEPSLRQGLRL